MQYRNKWFRSDEESNALDYLRKAGFYVERVDRDRWCWKWIAILLHGALYGFAICAIRGSDDESVLDANGRLFSFGKALRLAQSEEQSRLAFGSQPLVLSDSQQRSIDLLSETLRDEFMHFNPKGWSIEMHGLPGMVIDVLAVIRFLAVESGGYMHLLGRQQREVRSICFQSSRIMKRSSLYREANSSDEKR